MQGDERVPPSAPLSLAPSPIKVKKEPGPSQAPNPGRRTVCDNCRRRRIRCDGQFPCLQCTSASLACRRDHVPKKRGPKRGHGRVINELRAREAHTVPRGVESAGSSEYEAPPEAKRRDSLDGDANSSAHTSATASATASAAASPNSRSFLPPTIGADPRRAPEPRGIFTSDAYQPYCQNYFPLIPRCIDLYYEHIYPIMPLVFMPTIRLTISRPMQPFEENLVYALCALTSLHMAGRSLAVPGQPPWDEVGRFFLDECVSVRQRYDFLEDTSIYAVISSFWLSTSFFEINQSRKSWFYLREALTLAIDLRLYDDRSYIGLMPDEILCRQRVFWILFVTERSFAILRNKPLTLRKTPQLPNTRHDYEPPEIHAGFLKLVSSYAPLDESFVAAWNDGSDQRVSATTYLNLQQLLAQPLDFLRPRSEEGPDPTAIQKADLMITQQWLRLIVWQSSFRQGLLSTASADQSFSFSFPLSIARDTAAILQSMPSRAVEVHGMGIFEKIFEIGTWSVNVMGAYDSGSVANHPSMHFVGGSELALFAPSGRSGAVLDPLEFFVRTLSASPNSKTMYADKLLLFAEQTPGGVRTNLSPVLPPPGCAASVPSRQGSSDQADLESRETSYDTGLRFETRRGLLEGPQSTVTGGRDRTLDKQFPAHVSSLRPRCVRTVAKRETGLEQDTVSATISRPNILRQIPRV